MLMSMTCREAAASELSWINQKYDEVGFVHSSQTDYLVIAEIDGEPAGIGRLVAIGEASGELGGIYVFPAYRRKGVAEKIVGQLVAANKFDSLFCLPFSKLKQFYCGFGFEELSPQKSVPRQVSDKLNWCNDNPRYEDSTVLLMLRPVVVR